MMSSVVNRNTCCYHDEVAPCSTCSVTLRQNPSNYHAEKPDIVPPSEVYLPWSINQLNITIAEIIGCSLPRFVTDSIRDVESGANQQSLIYPAQNRPSNLPHYH